jgi:prepilin-type N-terminal cleavage/methylation domain-containing protein
MKNQKKKGFTLIELLVVIAIIGLLATLSVVALNNARERARDSRRVSDIRQIQTALELYYNANPVTGYPAVASDTAAHTALSSALDSYINPIPESPTPNDCPSATWAGTYLYAGGGNSYTLKYCLGSTTGEITGQTLQTATEMGIK